MTSFLKTMQAIQTSMPLVKTRQVRPMGGWENKARGKWDIRFFILPSFEGPCSALKPDSVQPVCQDRLSPCFQCEVLHSFVKPAEPHRHLGCAVMDCALSVPDCATSKVPVWGLFSTQKNVQTFHINRRLDGIWRWSGMVSWVPSLIAGR